MCCAATLSRTGEDVERLWRLDAIGIDDAATSSKFSYDEEDALRQFEDGLTYSGNRYTTVMPKRASVETLLNNLPVAANRLVRKVKQPSDYLRYNEEIRESIFRSSDQLT